MIITTREYQAKERSTHIRTSNLEPGTNVTTQKETLVIVLNHPSSHRVLCYKRQDSHSRTFGRSLDHSPRQRTLYQSSDTSNDSPRSSIPNNLSSNKAEQLIRFWGLPGYKIILCCVVPGNFHHNPLAQLVLVSNTPILQLLRSSFDFSAFQHFRQCSNTSSRLQHQGGALVIFGMIKLKRLMRHEQMIDKGITTGLGGVH